MSDLRIVLDRGLCQGHAVCTGESPAHFRLAADGSLELIRSNVSAEEKAQVEAAVKYCPNSALKLVPQ